METSPFSRDCGALVDEKFTKYISIYVKSFRLYNYNFDVEWLQHVET